MRKFIKVDKLPFLSNKEKEVLEFILTFNGFRPEFDTVCFEDDKLMKFCFSRFCLVAEKKSNKWNVVVIDRKSGEMACVDAVTQSYIDLFEELLNLRKGGLK